MITSTANKQIKRVRTLQTKRAVRKREGAFVIEGTRMVAEALRTGQNLELLLHTTEWASRNQSLLAQTVQAADHSEIVSDAVLGNVSDVETPQGVLAVVPIRSSVSTTNRSTTLILDRIADPGNLGTILRTALAANAGRIFLTPGSVDAFNPKVVRAGMGAHFSLDVLEAPIDEIIAGIHGQQLWIAEARQGEVYHRVDWRASAALAIGSEAHGVDPAFQSSAAGVVHVPIDNRTESLNAATAAAVILFEIQRQRET